MTTSSAEKQQETATGSHPLGPQRHRLNEMRDRSEQSTTCKKIRGNTPQAAHQIKPPNTTRKGTLTNLAEEVEEVEEAEADAMAEEEAEVRGPHIVSFVAKMPGTPQEIASMEKWRRSKKKKMTRHEVPTLPNMFSIMPVTKSSIIHRQVTIICMGTTNHLTFGTRRSTLHTSISHKIQLTPQ